ncbi:unnamed protein product, partial [marine sediment metagenome]
MRRSISLCVAAILLGWVGISGQTINIKTLPLISTQQFALAPLRTTAPDSQVTKYDVFCINIQRVIGQTY